MGKNKKNKKEDPAADLSDAGSDCENVEPTAPAPKPEKKSKKGRKKDLELEEAQREMEALALGEDINEESEEKSSSQPKKKKEKKKKAAKKEESDQEENNESEDEKPSSKKKGGGFSLLMADDDDDSASPEPSPKPKKKAPPKKSAFELLAAQEDSDDDDKDSVEEVEVKKVEKKPAEKKDKKKKKKKEKKEEEEDDFDKMLAQFKSENVDDDGFVVVEKDDESSKSAAQKKKEKKERQKMAAALKKESGGKEDEEPEKPDEDEAADEEKDDKKGGKKKKKKKNDDMEKEDKKKKKPAKGTLLAMQEALKKVQEEEEKRRIEEEERIAKEEALEEARLEKKRLEEEKKAAKKERERLKKEQLKKEGKYLTAKQKQQKAQAEAMLQAMRAQGMEVPSGGEKRAPRPGTRIRPKKQKSETPEVEVKEEEPPKEEVKEEPPNAEEKPAEPEEDDVKDAWDASSEDEAPIEEVKEEEVAPEEESEEESEEASDDEEESDEESDDDESESEEECELTRREKALNRIEKRRSENEAKRTTDELRAPVVCVLGHVDTGKTKILDKLRRTNVQDGEAGGITQQIGATNVPIDVVKEQCKNVKNFAEMGLKLPGLLIIDTPGHESFSNLRDRGSSLCDIAILVVDIMHNLEPQTIESINLLKKKKTPFVVALNKIDRLYEWKSNRHKDIEEVVKTQQQNTKLEFQKRSKEVITALAEQGLNAALCWENPDPKTYIHVVPTSAHTGEGMGNLMALLVKLSQTMLAKRLSFSDELQATVLEVKAIPGLGTTIDIVLVNGTLKEGSTIIVAGTDGPIVTQIKALLTPSKMQDLRVKVNYIEHKVLRAAQGVKIAAKELEKSIAGLNMLVAHQADEIEICKEEIQAGLDRALNSIKLKQEGVFVQASTLGSLEALLEFLRTSKIPYAGVKIGPVVKRDVMKASVMLEHEEKYTVILAFDVKVERDAQEMADSMGVKVFQADIIYHLFDRFTAYQEDLKKQKRDEFKHIAVFPCKLKILPNFVFNSRDPIVAGFIVEAGVVRSGTPVCVPSKEFLDIGIVTSIQNNHKEQDAARKGDEVCIKIEPIPGESPKMFGRHFDETDMIVSKISRASIDACKNYFRDDLQKSDWQLMVELKKTFQIL